jgi:hypothetical protein
LQSRLGQPHLVQVLPVPVEYTVRELRSVIGTEYQSSERRTQPPERQQLATSTRIASSPRPNRP